MHRNQVIDAFRGIAVLLVMLSHLPVETTGIPFVGNLFFYLIRGGWIGVDLFFVLSGYLVSGLLFIEYKKYNKIDPKRFLIRRGFKIYPSFWVLIIATFVLHYFKTPGFWAKEKIGFLGEILFVQNYVGYVWGHTWSLAVEEHFYLLLTFLFFILAKKEIIKLNTIAGIYLILLVVATFFRVKYSIEANTYSLVKQHYYSHIRMDALFAGVFLSYCNHFNKEVIARFLKYKAYLIPCALGVISLNFIYARDTNWWVPVVMLSLNPIAFGFIMVYLLESRGLKNMKSNFLSYIGKYSYSIYLWHMPVNSLLYATIFPFVFRKLQIPMNFPFYIICYLFSALIVGIVMSKIIEYPFLKLRDKVAPSVSLKKEIALNTSKTGNITVAK